MPNPGWLRFGRRYGADPVTFLLGRMSMLVSRWGNSLAIRLPASVVKRLCLQEGDDLEVIVTSDRTFNTQKKLDRTDLVARLKQFQGMIPADFKFDREEANARR